MNRLRGLTLAILASVLMMAVAAFAKEKNHHSVDIPQTVQVGTSRLEPGKYTMQWNLSGSTADVSFVRNGKSVARVPAKVVNLDHPAPTDSVTVKTTAGNAEALEEIEFDGQREAFSFTEQPAGE
jgi:hypothetical protein